MAPKKEDEKAAEKGDKMTLDAPAPAPAPPAPAPAPDVPSGPQAPDYGMLPGSEPRDYREAQAREPRMRMRGYGDARRPPPPVADMNADTATQMRHAPSSRATVDYGEEDPDADMVSVINHEPRLLIWPDLPVRNGDDPAGRVIKVIPGPRLIPGRNNVPREYLARMNLEHGDHRDPDAHPHLGRAFKHRLVTLGGDVSEPLGPGKPADLNKVSAGVARELIRTEDDPAQLDDWATSERRADVSRALVQRKEELAARR